MGVTGKRVEKSGIDGRAHMMAGASPTNSSKRLPRPLPFHNCFPQNANLPKKTPRCLGRLQADLVLLLRELHSIERLTLAPLAG